MTEPLSARAVELLLDEAVVASDAGRYGPAQAAATRAVQAAERLDDPGLLVQALFNEAEALRLQGDDASALPRYTRVLAMVEDLTSLDWLEEPAVAATVTGAYAGWVTCAQNVGGIAVRELFGVLDAGERFVRSIGRPQWRAGLLLYRTSLHQQLGELDAALATAEEALAFYHPDAPGPSLAGYRSHLADLLRMAGQSEQAESHYQAILDDVTDIDPVERVHALRGLAWCGLNRDDVKYARRCATDAVRAAEPLGHAVLLEVLEVLVMACLAEGDLTAADRAATQLLDLARRIGGHAVLYGALCAVVHVAGDRGELDAARDLLAELDEHAAALDRDTGTTRATDGVAQYRQWLVELDEPL